MTDKELIHALRCCDSCDCLRCGLGDVCGNLDTQAADRLEALLAENEHFREVTKMIPRWVSVKERLPETGRRVIIAREGDKVEQGIFLNVNGWWKVYGANTKNVTYWMPFPKPPSTEGVE